MAKDKRLTRFPRESQFTSCYSIEHNEEKELQCPKCGCEKIVFEDSTEACTAGHMYLGLKAACYECGHEFVVTENCWKVVQTFDDV
jgi:hypothetical protein